MAYELHNFQSGQILTAQSLNEIDNEVSKIEALSIEKYYPKMPIEGDYEASYMMKDGATNRIIKTTFAYMRLKKYKVRAGFKYRIFGTAISARYDTHYLAAFSTQDYDGTANKGIDDVIISGDGHSSIEDDYNVEYTAPDNGYIYLSNVISGGKGNNFNLSLVTPSYVLNDINLYVPKAYIGMNSNNTSAIIQTTTSDAFGVRIYKVCKNTKYRIHGNARIRFATYPLIVFSVDKFTGATQIGSDAIIVPAGDTATDKYYDLEFVPSKDGYICIAVHSSYANTLIVDEYIPEKNTSEYVDKSVNNDGEYVKLQAFGDSITDDSWRKDGTTWLTLLPDMIPQRKWDIVNSAVGGSHSGHGKVSDSPRYRDLDYNFVHDLVTNESIFRKDNDIITIMIGTNDFNSGHLGQWGDTTVSTFYGALRSVCEYISANTKSCVYFITPVARPDNEDSSKNTNSDGARVDSDGNTLRDFADAIRRTAQFYGYPVIDLNADLGWNSKNVRPYMDTEGVHPNIAGCEVICKYISSVIKMHLGV